MSYNVIDILDKVIHIENKKSNLLNDLINDKKNPPTLRLIGKVFLKQCNETVFYYENIKSHLNNEELAEIDIMTYDKMSFLINEFNSRIYMPKLNTTRDYLHYALDMAKDKHSLFVDIQGRLFNNSRDKDSITYEVLTDIICNAEKQAECIKGLIV